MSEELKSTPCDMVRDQIVRIEFDNVAIDTFGPMTPGEAEHWVISIEKNPPQFLLRRAEELGGSIGECYFHIEKIRNPWRCLSSEARNKIWAGW